ncbi:MAG: DUF3021 domain-containing protein [Firmicutes bacterium HGW-Firmicutes-9]|jgi:hypothetical protein|nr:MAG: DUF3021 domain-containing protein [Firmicutes bacterium HGW-Firmicutes-9]
MRKEILKRCLFGMPIGLASSTVITILISVFVGDGAYYAVVPAFAQQMGGELNAVLLQAGLSMIYGAAWAGASVIWDAEKWSLLKMTLVHLLVTTLATFPIAYFARWMPHNATGVLLYIGIFVVIYIGVWLGQYGAMKKRIQAMNAKLQN